MHGSPLQVRRRGCKRSQGIVQRRTKLWTGQSGLFWVAMAGLWRNLRIGVRQVWRNRFFSGIVILLLAIGIGANTLVFSLVNELLLKPMPVRNPQNLYLVEKNREKQVRPDADFEYL